MVLRQQLIEMISPISYMIAINTVIQLETLPPEAKRDQKNIYRLLWELRSNVHTINGDESSCF